MQNKQNTNNCLIINLINTLNHSFVIHNVAQYFDNIYDLLTLFLINKSMKVHLEKMFYPLLQTIIENNLKIIINDKLNLTYTDFKIGILNKLGLVLSGSTMLLSICGNKWAHNNNTFNIFDKMIKQCNVKINQKIYDHEKTRSNKQNFDINASS